MADNKLIKTTLLAAGVVLPTLKETDPNLATAINLLIKADKAFDNPKANAILDVVSTQVPVVKKIDKNAAAAMDVAIKSIKTANVYDSVNPETMLQLVEAVLPMIKLMHPTVGMTTEVGVGLSKTYINYSKSESVDYKTIISLISSFLPVLYYNKYQSAGVTVDVLTNYAKTDRGEKLLKFMSAKVYNKYVVKNNEGDTEEWNTIFGNSSELLSNNSEFDKGFVNILGAQTDAE